jgi:hypothetical protein
MRYFLSGLLSAAWALWFGGVVTMLLFMNRLFQSMHDEFSAVFHVVAPPQFRLSERFGLVAGGLALLSAFAMRLLTRGRAATWLFVLFAITAALEGVRPAYLAPRMQGLVTPGQTPPPEFARLHGMYMAAAGLEAIFLLLAAFALPAVMRAPSKGIEDSLGNAAATTASPR